jgi:hypothetical protein
VLTIVRAEVDELPEDPVVEEPLEGPSFICDFEPPVLVRSIIALRDDQELRWVDREPIVMDRGGGEITDDEIRQMRAKSFRSRLDHDCWCDCSEDDS